MNDGCVSAQEKYGAPKGWLCPDCGVLFMIHPGLPFDHLCDKEIRSGPKESYFAYRLDSNSYVTEFIVFGDHDPDQYVECHMPDDTVHRWDKRREGDLLVFKAPPGYDISRGLGWRFDKRLQYRVEMPDAMLEKFAMRGRVSA